MISFWQTAAHPVFFGQLRDLLAKSKSGDGAGPFDALQLTIALKSLCLRRIPKDPFHPDFEPDATCRLIVGLWRRAFFGNQRYMLLFRADEASRLIVYGQVVDIAKLKPALNIAESTVMLSDICLVSANDQVTLPSAIRDYLSVQKGGRVSLHIDNLRDKIALRTVEPGEQPLTALAQRMVTAHSHDNSGTVTLAGEKKASGRMHDLDAGSVAATSAINLSSLPASDATLPRFHGPHGGERM